MYNSLQIILNSDLYIYFSKKREREEEEELDGKYPVVDLLRNVGEMGKGFVRDVYLLKDSRLTN